MTWYYLINRVIRRGLDTVWCGLQYAIMDDFGMSDEEHLQPHSHKALDSRPVDVAADDEVLQLDARGYTYCT